MQLVCFNVVGDFHNSSTYESGKFYYYWKGVGDPLQALRKAMKVHYPNNSRSIKYQDALRDIPDIILSKYGIVPLWWDEDNLVEVCLRTWDSYNMKDDE